MVKRKQTMFELDFELSLRLMNWAGTKHSYTVLASIDDIPQFPRPGSNPLMVTLEALYANNEAAKAVK